MTRRPILGWRRGATLAGAALLALAAASCGEDPMQPGEVLPGEYVLVAVGGSALPQVAFSGTDGERLLVGGDLSIPAAALAHGGAAVMARLTLRFAMGPIGGPHKPSESVVQDYFVTARGARLEMMYVGVAAMALGPDTLVASGTRLAGRVSVPAMAVGRPELRFERAAAR